MDYRRRCPRTLRPTAPTSAEAVVDWRLIKDIVALTWEIQRSRRRRETVMRMGVWMRFSRSSNKSCQRAERPHQEWLNGDSQAVERVAEVLHKLDSRSRTSQRTRWR